MTDSPKQSSIQTQERRIGLIQTRVTESLSSNLSASIEGIRDAAERGAQIICTQELFRSPYFCQTESPEYFELAEPIPSSTTEALAAEASSLGVVIVGSVFEERAPGVFHNTAVVFDADGALLGRYRKMHIPDDPGFHEKYYFTPGDQGFRVWRTQFGVIGVLICWDQWFPEAARLTAMQGAEILFYPTAIGWLPGERQAGGEKYFHSWQTIQRSHAIANGCFVAAVNRVGMEQPKGTEGIEFWGGSFLSDPYGQILGQASTEQSENLVISIDVSEIKRTRIEWPFLRDRRVDAYAGLTERYLEESVR